MKEREKYYCKTIGAAIRQIRIEKYHKSALMFAYENDIPKSTLTRIERGENEPQVITLKKIAEAFGWSMSELLKILKKIYQKILKFLMMNIIRGVLC